MCSTSSTLNRNTDQIQTVIEQWLEFRNRYLHILLEMEGRPSSPKCSICNRDAGIKCPDCFGSPLFCKGCCVEAHRRSPFHRPLVWTATHYTPVSLHSLGFVLFIGHNGAPCPQTVEVCLHSSWSSIHMLICTQGIQAAQESHVRLKGHTKHGPADLTTLYTIEEDQVSPEIDEQLPTPRDTPQPEGTTSTPIILDTLFDHLEVFLESSDSIPGRTYTAPSGNPMLTVVDRSGVFEVEMVFCVCLDKDNKDEQLLQSGLFPATFKSIKTLFTFGVLDDFLRDNLECKTTAQQYYSKLQSSTSKMFSYLVPVCHAFTLSS